MFSAQHVATAEVSSSTLHAGCRCQDKHLFGVMVWGNGWACIALHVQASRHGIGSCSIGAQTGLGCHASSVLQCSLSWACCCRFLEGDLDDPAANSRRHNMLKLIPSVPQGSWIIKQSVGSTPVLLGNKISTTYHRYHSLIPPAKHKHRELCILNRSTLYRM